MTDRVHVTSSLSLTQIAALGEILDSLAGTPLAGTGDVSIAIDDVRYVINQQTGNYAAAMIQRDGGMEVIGAMAPYRRKLVQQTAALGLERAREVPIRVEFTLRELIGDAWSDLSPVEQRNAGKRFRVLLEPKPIGNLEEWKLSDNEWHYRRY